MRRFGLAVVLIGVFLFAVWGSVAINNARVNGGYGPDVDCMVTYVITNVSSAGICTQQLFFEDIHNRTYGPQIITRTECSNFVGRRGHCAKRSTGVFWQKVDYAGSVYNLEVGSTLAAVIFASVMTVMAYALLILLGYVSYKVWTRPATILPLYWPMRHSEELGNEL